MHLLEESYTQTALILHKKNGMIWSMVNNRIPSLLWRKATVKDPNVPDVTYVLK